MRKISYQDLESKKILFKNLISGPAPVGRILNYLKLVGENKLQHKNGYRELSLSENIGSAWCTEFMVGLGLIYYENYNNDSSVYPIKLTDKGMELYNLIKTYNSKFDESSTNILKCKIQLWEHNVAAYNLFKDIFINSAVFLNLFAYISNNGINRISTETFFNSYYSFFLDYYKHESYIIPESGASTGENRVPSLTQLCNFFGFLEKDNNILIFNLPNIVEKFNIYDNYSKFKSLLSFFVKQIRINLEVIEGEKTSGQGYKDNSSIRSYYEEYRNYGDFTLDCNLQSGFHKTHSGTNYINVTGTGIDIRPKYNKDLNDFDKLCIDLADLSIDGIEDILNKEYVIEELDLFSDNEPNDKLKGLFDDYLTVINKWKNESKDTKQAINYVSGNAYNKIIYGTPGCGKSYYVKNTLLKDYDDKLVVRTTFYQDYSNTDFVGQIIPVIEQSEDGTDKVTYKFNPGPFTIALEKALNNPNQNVALVIEELNRGNAASIFGDIFQLLDRDENGISDYGITNVNIAKYLNESTSFVFNNDSEIKLPGNLSIIATMNTSDQNVFTLDTAFKRRWEFEKISNIFTDDHLFKELFIPGMKIDWEHFVNNINDYILQSGASNSEDKQIGVYFVDGKGLRKSVEDVSTIEDRKKFAYKIFEYLWDDVAKFDHEKWFNTNIKSLDQLIQTYVKEGSNDIDGIKVFNNGIFKD